MMANTICIGDGGFERSFFNGARGAVFGPMPTLCRNVQKELVKKDEAAMTDLRKALLNMDSLEAPLRLGDLETTIQFVETHLYDIKIILEKSG